MTRLPVFVALLCRWMHQEQNDVIALDPAAQRRGEPPERNHGRYVSDVDLVLGQNEVDGYGVLRVWCD